MTELQPRLVPAAPDDMEALLPLVRAYHEFEKAKLTDAERALALRPLLQDPALGIVWLIRVEAEVIGYLAVCFGYSIEFMGKDAFVDEFFIGPDWRGLGIGGQVLSAACEYLAGSGVKALHLEVARDNQRARSLYQASGFDNREQFHLMSKVL